MLPWVAGTSLCVMALVGAELRANARLRAVAKVGASTGFLLTGLAAGLPGGSPVQQAVFAGLVFGAIGDVCLLSREKRPFLLGIGAFLLNHVAYVGAFVALGMDGSITGLAAVPLAVLAGAVGRVVVPRAGSLKGPVVAYITVISAMVACAIGAAAAGSGRGALVAGAVLYFVSDLAVARDRFVHPGPLNKVWGLPTYYAAQLLFAACTPSA